MSVALLIIGHEQLGAALLATAEQTLGSRRLPVEVLGVSRDCEPEQVLSEARKRVRRLDQGEGVLVLTDLYGATPCNIAMRLLDEPRVRVLSGVNLPMLIRILNYPGLSLDELVERAVSGGRSGIVSVPPEA